MIKIGLISDTHGYLDQKILDHFAGCDEIWHAGDLGTLQVVEELKKEKVLRAVYGNIDGPEIRSLYPEHQIFRIDHLKVWMTHIGGFPPKYNPETRKKLIEIDPDLYICGHSHIAKVVPDKQNRLIHINPGAAGHEGFHTIRTIVRFAIENSRLKDLEMIELGRRGIIRE